MSSFFTNPVIFSSAIALRIVLLFYGLFQDEYSPLKYTDIDYFVFTDAARYVSRGLSPYERETYRYTPLLAWLLLPTAWPGTAWFSFGKAVFAVSDIIAGWLIVLVLRSPEGGKVTTERALKFASIWLLNPMVATISTRGSSEGLLGVLVVALFWAVTHRRITLAGVLLGLAVHSKIYPFIYGPSIIWFLEEPSLHPTPRTPEPQPSAKTIPLRSSRTIRHFFNRPRLTLLLTSLTTFTSLNLLMYTIYSTPFLTHTYLHHLTRIDHRHNFSPYNTLLHLSSALPSETSKWHFESLAFIPQLALSAVLIPLVLAKRDLAGAMLAQTFAFVAFNKVCTSQVSIFSHYYK
jgi:phosphatidylinositol glycan class M